MSLITSKTLKRCFLAAAIVSLALGLGLSQQSTRKVDFRRDVQPLLRQQCIQCHGPSQQMGNFRLDRRRDAMRGGRIAVIAPGNSAGSRLYHKLIGTQYGQQMPPTGALSAEQISIIKDWIDQGAEWPDDVSGETPPPQPDPKATRLLTLLRDGDLAAFQQLIRDEPKVVNLKGPGGTTPLMQAVLYGDVAAVRLLLEKGADVNLRNEAGATALLWAVDDLEKTRLLLDHGADVNTRSDDGRTPLLIAAGLASGSGVVKLLLERSAKITSKPSLSDPVTPLATAAAVGDVALLRLLLERGADVKSAGLNPLVNALRSGCTECVELLKEGADQKAWTTAAFALVPPAGDGRRLKELLERGADANAKDDEGRTLLMLAASSDAVPAESVAALIQHGADVNAKDPRGKTALDFARLRGSTAVVEVLIKAGAKEGVPVADIVWSARTAPSPRAALERGLPLLQKADANFLRKSGCVSCHHNTLTLTTMATARKSGVQVDEQSKRDHLTQIGTYLESWRERALQGIGIAGGSNTISYILMGLADGGYQPDAATDAMARYLLLRQRPDGRWSMAVHRPPIESNEIEVTAASLKSLKEYGPKTQREKYEAAVQRAAAWLLKAQPRTTEERAFQLLGLRWAGIPASNPTIKRAVRELLAQQRSDGGWSQLPSLASDAYATGQALVALQRAGALPVKNRGFQRGIGFLMKTQAEDGSWYVRSRAIPFQPYFESGFPYVHDQWISAAGSNWAATALALAVQPQRK